MSEHRFHALSIWRPDGEWLVCRDCNQLVKAPRRERMRETTDQNCPAAKEATDD